MATTLSKSPWMTVAEAAKSGKAVEIEIDGVIGAYDWAADSWQEAKRLTKQAMRKELKALAALQTEKIVVNISSPGGYTDHALAIHDTLAENPAEVTTRVYGQTASAATIIAQAADKGKRMISENALYLVHKCLSMLWGMFNANDLANILDDQTKITARIVALYARRSGKSESEIADLLEAQDGNGRWLDPDEALSLGLVDAIYAPAPVFSIWQPEILAECMLPPLPEKYQLTKSEQNSPPSRKILAEIEPPAEIGASKPKNEDQKMLTTDQVSALKDRFGADFAVAQLTAEVEYQAALEAGAEMLAARLVEQTEALAAKQTECDGLAAQVAELEAKVAGYTDPLAKDENRTDGAPPEDKKPAAPKPIPEAHADLVAAGKSPAEAWAELRKTRADDYAAHFRP
jgi:ATP-dependent protease ClpP protease subunit